MNYSEMSDQKINDMVAIARGRLISSHGKITLHEVEGLDLCTDFCNSWTDAGPIIHKEGISLYHNNGYWEAEMEYEAPVGAFGTDETCCKFISDTNPLRAAMIVFLMMQEGK